MGDVYQHPLGRTVTTTDNIWFTLLTQDTIYSQSEVLEKRESRSRENVGLVTVKTTGYNQIGETVITFKRTVMVYRRGHAPSMLRPNLGNREGQRA